MGKPNYQVWDTIDLFTMNDAAWLWADLEPEPNNEEIPRFVSSVFAMIASALESRLITYRRKTNGLCEMDLIAVKNVLYGIEKCRITEARQKLYLIPDDIYVARDDLVKLASEKKASPPFLFQEKRTEETGEVKANNLRKALALAALVILSDKGKRLGTIESPNVSQISSLISDQADQIPTHIGQFSRSGLSAKNIGIAITDGLRLIGIK